MEDFPPEALLQRPGAVGHLAALLRWGRGGDGRGGVAWMFDGFHVLAVSCLLVFFFVSVLGV